MASENSSASNIPSRSMSDSFQILPRIVLGSFDLTSSDLADAPVILPFIGFRFYTHRHTQTAAQTTVSSLFLSVLTAIFHVNLG